MDIPYSICGDKLLLEKIKWNKTKTVRVTSFVILCASILKSLK